MDAAGSPTTIHLERAGAGAVAVVRLDKPDTLNSLTFASYATLIQTFQLLADDTATRAIVVTGSGRAFCSGGGVVDIIEPLLAMPHADKLAFTRMTGALVRAIRACPQPVVAAVNGMAAGAGALIVLAADLRVFAEHAKAAFLFVKVGLSGADMGAAWLLPRVIGLGRATELLMTGRTVDAEEALRIGLANRVVPDARLMEEALVFATRLADGPAFALAMTKEMLDREAPMSLETAIEAEAQAQAICMETPEFREGHRAFVEKRPPCFAAIPPPKRRA